MRRDRRGGPEGRGRRAGAERTAACASLVPRPREGAQGRGARARAQRRNELGRRAGPGGREGPAPSAHQEAESSRGPPPPLVGPSGARLCAGAPLSRRKRPPPGAAGSRRAGMPPLLAPLLCLALLPALAARGRRSPASPQLSAPFGNFGGALSARPGGWERATRGPGRGTDPPPRRLPDRDGLTPPAPVAGFEAGHGALGAPGAPGGPALGSSFVSHAWGLPPGQAGDLPTTFRFESSRFWFPVALGAIYLFPRLWPALGADVGARSVGSGVSRCFYRAVRRGRAAGRGGQWGGPAFSPFRRIGEGPGEGRGPRGSPSHACLLPRSRLADSLAGGPGWCGCANTQP